MTFYLSLFPSLLPSPEIVLKTNSIIIVVALKISYLTATIESRPGLQFPKTSHLKYCYSLNCFRASWKIIIYSVLLLFDITQSSFPGKVLSPTCLLKNNYLQLFIITVAWDWDTSWDKQELTKKKKKKKTCRKWWDHGGSEKFWHNPGDHTHRAVKMPRK